MGRSSRSATRSRLPAVVGLSFSEVAEAFAAERPKYEQVAGRLESRLRDELQTLGLETIVQARAKTVASFTKKALRKGYADPLKQIGDKAGVRVIVHFEDDVPAVQAVVESIAEVVKSESKLDTLEPDRLGYLGVHMDLTMTTELFDADSETDLIGLPVELQIHTKAQSAWAVISHELLYKSASELSPALQRSITRLMAVVELFDGEITRLRHAIEADPDFRELVVLRPLDDKIVEFTNRKPDRELSALVVPSLVRLYDVEPTALFNDVVEPFLERHDQRLRDLFAAYTDDDRANPLLYQPEALLTFERLETDPARLREAWPLARDLLDSLETVWGIDIS